MIVPQDRRMQRREKRQRKKSGCGRNGRGTSGRRRFKTGEPLKIFPERKKRAAFSFKCVKKCHSCTGFAIVRRVRIYTPPLFLRDFCLQEVPSEEPAM